MLLNAETPKYNAKIEKALLAVLTHPTLTGAAKAIGISETTLYRMMQEPDFVDAYAQARRDAMQQAVGSLQQAAGKATETLLAVMQAEDSPATARISAARSVLEYAFKGSELLDMETRIQALEAAQEAQTGSKA